MWPTKLAIEGFSEKRRRFISSGEIKVLDLHALLNGKTSGSVRN
jgi:hypothetical protein